MKTKTKAFLLLIKEINNININFYTNFYTNYYTDINH